MPEGNVDETAGMGADNGHAPEASPHDPLSGQDLFGLVPRGAGSAKAYRILIADGQTVVRRGLRSLLEPQYGIEICGEAATGTEAIEQVKTLKPDLVILDLELPEVNGLDATEQIREASPDTEVLVLTIHLTTELAREVLRTGALGYVLKSDTERDLLVAVDQMRRRKPFFTTRLTVEMARSFLRVEGDKTGGEEGEVSPLTEREMSVLQMLAEGKSNKEVASALSVSVRTVESHRNRIMHKMNFGSFSELVRYAVRNSLVDP
jgi:DNA-binding NarL/FixJ family response regulator